MHASFTRTLVVVGLLATSLTGCQSTSLGKFSIWKPKWPSFGRNKDAALASNATTGADSTASPWMPSQGATPGYAPATANNGYGVNGQYNTGYAGMPTSYTGADPAQNPWSTTPATGAPAAPNTQYDAAAYAAQPAAAPQTGYYDGYGQQPAANPYAQPAPSYAPATASAPMTQGTNSWDPATQYGPAPSAYPQQQYAPQAAPAAQMADNPRYPAATQYDGGQQWNQGATAAPAAYDASAAPPQQEQWPPAQQGGYPTGTQSNPQYQQPAGSAAPQPYRPGGTTDYAPSTNSGVTPASYDPSPQGTPSYQQ